MSDKTLRSLCIAISVSCLCYLLYVGIGAQSLSSCDRIEADRVSRWHLVSMRQVWDQLDGGFGCLVSLIFEKKPLMWVIISQEILPRIFALPGSFEFSATLDQWLASSLESFTCLS